MMRSLYSGVSGLKNHQTRMDVIGNNIANVNTAGFKASRVVFQDVYSQMTKGASAPNGTTVGGTNSRQIGLGVNLAAIDIIHSSAATQRTDGELDLAIEGDGFFTVISPEGYTLYTRAGNLYVDEAGNLVTAGGAMIQGLQATSYIVEKATYDADGTLLTPAKIMYDKTAATTATTGGTAAPTLGTPPTEAELLAYEIWCSNPANLFDPNDKGVAGAGNTFYNGDGTLKDEYEIVTSILPAWFERTSPTGMPDEMATQRTSTVKTTLMNENYFTNLNVAGFTGISFDDKGFIKGLDATGEERIIGVIALATFTNTGGLDKRGNSVYAVTANSGDPVYNQAMVGGAGKINPGGLEMSNVDLANEFTDMIVTQRGFQANSRIITVSDTMLEELINLKR